LGFKLFKSLVSSLAGRLDVELSARRNRQLEAAAYPHLLVNARYEKVRVGSRIVSKGVLIASAVRVDGSREVVAVEVVG
jgi:putative transposase